MTHLTPHDWDAIGQPPLPGKTYGAASTVGEALVVADALREADDLDRDAERDREEADEKEQRAADARKAIEPKLAVLRNGNPRLARLIEEDPWKFANQAAIERALADDPGIELG